MATNPMQRKARNSFLLGMLVMLLIAGAIIALLLMQLMEKDKKEKIDLQNSVSAYVLNKDVKSGQTITTDMLTLQKVNKTLVPSNATSDLSIIQNYALQDKEGNNITTEYRTSNGQTTSTMYITIDNQKYEVKKEEQTDNYYIEKNRQKQYLELNSVPLVAKVDMKANTLITTDLISKSDNMVQDDVRKQEYNVVVMPVDLATGDYIDIRLMLPNGQDFIVVSKKEVTIPNIAGTDSTDTLWVNLAEDETLHMSSAIIDAAKVKGAKLYATKYTEAGMQKASTPNYVVSEAVSKELSNDPNILEKAMEQLKERYNNGNSAEIRNNYINSATNGGEQAQTNLETNVTESITNSKNSRKSYLEGLSGATSTDGTTSSSSTTTTSN